MALGVSDDQCHGRFGAAMDFEAQRACLPRGIAFKGLAKLPIQHRIIGLPNAVSDLDALEVHRTTAEGQFDEPVPQGPYTIDTATFFRKVRAPRIKADAITELERPFEAKPDRTGPHGGNLAQKHSPLFTEARVSQFLVIDAPEPSGVEPATEGHF